VDGHNRKTSINLALQGGGAHGAFTWGVLDRLLREDWIVIDTVSATSAGAVNTVAMLSGLVDRGREGASTALRALWEGVLSAAAPDISKMNPLLGHFGGLDRFGSSSLAQLTGLVSPYAFNPFDFNPLRKLLIDIVDFDRIRHESAIDVLIAATDASTGRARLFRKPELTVEVVLASSCLPLLHHAIKIGDSHYWDGGFSANPDLVTLARETKARDTVLVLLNPTSRDQLPTQAADILGQINRITFNQPLIRDVREILSVREALTGPGALLLGSDAKRLARHRFHLIDGGPHTATLSDASKMLPERATTMRLFEAGVRETEGWLARHGRDLGRRETVDLAMRLPAPRPARATQNRP
jgi:NTE family protein